MMLLIEMYYYLVLASDSRILCLYWLGVAAINRAIHGDKVAVRLAPKSEWRAPSSQIVENDADMPGDDGVVPVNESDARPTGSYKVVKYTDMLGRVVGILKRNWRAYAATFEARASTPSGTVAALVVPVDRRIPRIRIVTRQVCMCCSISDSHCAQAATLANQRIVVNIDKWEKTSKYPQGHYVRTLGPVGDRVAESDVLLVEHDIPHYSFSPAVLACLPMMPWAPTQADYTARADFRSFNICSIDPPGCTDIDDALHCMWCSYPCKCEWKEFICLHVHINLLTSRISLTR